MASLFAHARGHRLDCRLERRKVSVDDVPDHLVGNRVIFVPQHVADSSNASPFDLGPGLSSAGSRRVASEMISIARCTMKRNSQSASNSSNVLPATLCLDPFDGLKDVVERVGDLPFHQKTRTADCSMPWRSIGCRLSRVVTSTSTPSSSSSKYLMPTRSISENFLLGS